MNNDLLTENEKVFIDIYGETFERMGRSQNMGRIFGLMIIRAHEEDEGMDQETITSILERTDEPISTSTVSRTLKKMQDARYISYKMEIHGERARRKYYMKTDLKEMAVDRMVGAMKETHALIQIFEKLSAKVSSSELQRDQLLNDRISVFIGMYKAVIRLYEEFISRADELLLPE